jgi:hypothetical protein
VIWDEAGALRADENARIERVGAEEVAAASGKARWLSAQDEVGQEEGEASRGTTGRGGREAWI